MSQPGIQVFFQNLIPFTTGANRFLPAKAARLKPGSAYSILIAERVVPYWLSSGFPHSLADYWHDYRREGIPTRPERGDSLTKERKE